MNIGAKKMYTLWTKIRRRNKVLIHIKDIYFLSNIIKYITKNIINNSNNSLWPLDKIDKKIGLKKIKNKDNTLLW